MSKSKKRKNSQIKTTWKDLAKEFTKLRDKGYTIRKTAETEFLIDDKIRRFSIATISKTIKKYEGNLDVTQDNKNKDRDVVKVFRLLRKDWSPSEIVDKKGYHPDFVFKVAELYNKLENYEIIPKEMKEILFSEASTISTCKNYDDLFEILIEGISAIHTLEKLVWKCSICKKRFKIGKEEIVFIQKCFEEYEWKCNQCLKKPTRDVLA